MRSLIGTIALAAALLAPAGDAQAFDESKYPDWKGQWRRAETGPPRYDTSRPLNDQQAPLTAEYQAIYAASLADQKAGGQGTDPTYTCIAARHAADHERLRPAGDRDHAGDHPHS